MERTRPEITKLLTAASKIILGKEHEMKLALCCILARGHLLIEDQPGMGKTTLAKVFAKLLGLEFTRIQFTSDLLPADILGVSIFDDKSQSFTFHKGPLFSSFVLADELNRASPKTQSACLQAMEENEVSVDGKTYDLPHPFVLIATQNPDDSTGTYSLPQSQLDRFLMKLHLGYPSETSERKLLADPSTGFRHQSIKDLPHVLDAKSLLSLQNEVSTIKTADPIVDYVLSLVRESRSSQKGKGLGLSPRAGMDLMSASQAWALIEGRSFVIPEDVQAVFTSVTQHRFGRDGDGKAMAETLIEQTPVL